MLWADFFEAGGWGMFPTLGFGFGLVASAVVFALRPERRWGRLTGSLGALTLGAGVLGTTVGLINTLRYLQRVSADELLKVAALGCAESLNNLVLALIFLVLAGLLVSVGAFRAARA